MFGQWIGFLEFNGPREPSLEHDMFCSKNFSRTIQSINAWEILNCEYMYGNEAKSRMSIPALFSSYHSLFHPKFKWYNLKNKQHELTIERTKLFERSKPSSFVIFLCFLYRYMHFVIPFDRVKGSYNVSLTNRNKNLQ